MILNGIVNLFDQLDKRRLEDDYHESQTGTQALRFISTQKLRETESLVFITFDQFFSSYPNIANEFIHAARHAISKGGITIFMVGLLLVMAKTNRKSKFSEKSMEVLLQWARTIQKKPSAATTRDQASFINGMPVPPVLEPSRPHFHLRSNERLIDLSHLSSRPNHDIDCKALVSACIDGWDICVAPLVDLAFKLVDLDFEDQQRAAAAASSSSSNGPASTSASSASTSSGINSTSKTKSSSKSTKAPLVIEPSFFSKQATDLLCSLFEGFEMIRSRIIDELFLNLLTRPETALVTVDIIRKLIYVNRSQMSPYLTKFNELVYQLSFLPPATTKRLIRALDPILSAHSDFKDLLIMVLRKASFSHDTVARSAAVSGFVQLLRAHLASLTTSQTLAPTIVEQIALECLSFVRRSFSQQPFIRASLYRDLAGAFNDALSRRSIVESAVRDSRTGNDPIEAPTSSCRAPPRVIISQRPNHFHPGTFDTLNTVLVSIVELILGQLSTVVNDDGKTAKFDLAHCLRIRAPASIAAARKSSDTSSSVAASIVPAREIQEPFHILLMAANCLILGESVGSNGLNLQTACTYPLFNTLDRFVQFILQSELEQFELDKSSDFSFDTPEGLANQEAATLLLGIYEMSAEYLLTVRSSSLHRKKGLEDDETTIPLDGSLLLQETEEEAQKRYANIHAILKMLMNLKGLVKEAKGSIKLTSNFKIASTETHTMDITEEGAATSDPPTKASGKASGGEKAVKTKMVFSRPSLFSRRCVVDFLTLVCNPIKASARRGAANEKIVDPLAALAGDFSVVQYVLSVALAQAQSLSKSAKTRVAQQWVMEEAIEGLVRNMDPPDFLEGIAGFLLYEAAAPPVRVQPLGAKPTSTLALEIFVQALKYVTTETNLERRQIAKFATSSVSYLLSNPIGKEILAPETSDEMKIALFVEMIQSFVSREKCFSNPTMAELYMDIISLLSPLLDKSRLKNIALWIESLISMADHQEDDSIEDTRRMANDLGLKLIPLMWSLLDRCDGDIVKSSYLMFARDVFITCGGNGTTGQYALEDSDRESSHSLTFSVVTKSTASDVANILIEHLERRISLIQALYTEITNSEKFVVVGETGVQIEESDNDENDQKSNSDDDDGEMDMDAMLTDEAISSTLAKPSVSAKSNRSHNGDDDDDDNDDKEGGDYEASGNVHLKRKAVLYKDFEALLEIFYCLCATRLPNTASITFAKVVQESLKLIHSWIAAQLKRKDFEPIIPSFESFISSLGLFFGRLHEWTTGWMQGRLPFLPSEEKKRQRMVSAARTAASKHAPSIVFWMEKIHAEALIKLAARADHPLLLKNFKSNPHHDFAFQEGGFADKILKKRKQVNQLVVAGATTSSDPPLTEPNTKRPRKR
jgi:hypothetical protein